MFEKIVKFKVIEHILRDSFQLIEFHVNTQH